MGDANSVFVYNPEQMVCTVGAVGSWKKVLFCNMQDHAAHITQKTYSIHRVETSRGRRPHFTLQVHSLSFSSVIHDRIFFPFSDQMDT